MDLENKKALLENGFKPRGEAYYYRGGWIHDGDEKEIFLVSKDKIIIKLKSLKEAESNLIELLKEIGTHAMKIKRLVNKHNLGLRRDKRISISTLFEECFSKDANRIYEAIALNKALKAGVSEKLPTTALIRIGEKLGNKKKSDTLREALKNDQIKIDGKFKRFSKLNQKEILQALREIGADETKKSRLKFLEDLEKNTLKTALSAGEIQKKFHWEKTKNKGAAQVKIGKIEDNLQKTKKTIEKIKDYVFPDADDRSSVKRNVK